MTPANLCHLDGVWLPLSQARIPVMDRGFLFADAVYEVIPVYAGTAFALDAHLQRLERSLRAVRIANPHTRNGWKRLIEELIERNGGGDKAVYVQVSRGVETRRDHAYQETTRATVFATASALSPVPQETLKQGLSAVRLEDFRWQRCDIKTTSLLANVMLKDDARRAGADEAVLIRHGLVTEGAASNLFMVRNETLSTPPADRHILPGITRDVVLALAQEMGIPVEIRPIASTELDRAQEIWLASSTREILAVTRLDHMPVGNGLPGPYWSRIRQAWQRFKLDWVRRHGANR
jgi:D-alanine transaminase